MLHLINYFHRYQDVFLTHLYFIRLCNKHVYTCKNDHNYMIYETSWAILRRRRKREKVKYIYIYSSKRKKYISLKNKTNNHWQRQKKNNSRKKKKKKKKKNKIWLHTERELLFVMVIIKRQMMIKELLSNSFQKEKFTWIERK